VHDGGIDQFDVNECSWREEEEEEEEEKRKRQKKVNR